MAAKGALQGATRLEALEVIFADPTSVGVLLIEKSYTLFVASTRGISTTTVEGNDVVGSGAVVV